MHVEILDYVGTTELVELFNIAKVESIRPGVIRKRVSYRDFIFAKTEYYCQDCGEPYPHCPMVKDKVWKECYTNGHACVSCLEDRLGRRLRSCDLLPVPHNDPWLWSVGMPYINKEFWS